MKEKIKNFLTFNKIFHFLSWIALASSIILVFTKYKVIFDRFIASLVYLKESVVTWFKAYFLGQDIIIEPNVSHLDLIEILPINTQELVAKFQNFYSVFFKLENFINYTYDFFFYLIVGILYVLLAIIFFILLTTIVSCLVEVPVESEMRGKKTFAVKLFNKYIEQPLKWFYARLKELIKAFLSKWYYKVSFLIIWLLNFNILAIIIEAVAWIFAFPVAPSAESLFYSIAKLILDVILTFLTSPTVVLLTIIAIIVISYLVKLAKQFLNDKLEFDKKYIRNSSPSIMISGPQGAGKSKLGAFIIRLIEIIFHEDLSDNLYQFQMEYTDFPFIMFEDEIREQKELGKIKGLTGVADFVNRKKEIYEATGDLSILYNYEGPLQFNNGIRYVDIFEMLIEYGKSYYIYIDNNSLAVTAIPVRTDLYKEDIGNFPLWNHDVLNRTPDDYEIFSKYSKVLVYDAFRCGNFVNKNSKYAGAFEYGVVWEPEKDKERGNKVTNAKYDMNSDKANPLNDMFSFGQKIRRHASNINYKSFWRSVADLQRTNSLNLDEMDLYDHLQILKKNTERVAIPFYFLFEIIFSYFDKFFRSFIDTVRFYGTEFTFPAYILRKAFSVLFTFQIRILNKYGYSIYKLDRTDACQHDKKAREEKLYFLNALGHADIYKSDSLQPFFSELVRLAGVSLEDFPDYDSLYLEIKKMKEQGSYLGEALFELIKKRKGLNGKCQE